MKKCRIMCFVPIPPTRDKCDFKKYYTSYVPGKRVDLKFIWPADSTRLLRDLTCTKIVPIMVLCGSGGTSF